MELKRDLDTKKIYLIDNGQKLLETGRVGAEFVIYLYTDNPITITQDLDEYLYSNLNQLLENEYVFANNGLSYKKDNMIVWFSDQYCDIEDEYEVSKVNRLILKKTEDGIQISYKNPFFEMYNIKRCHLNMVAFSPAGNGFYSRNINTGLSFQDDIFRAFYKTLLCEYDRTKKKIKKYKVGI